VHRPSRVLLFLPLVAAVAGGPFGGDDSGYVPPNRSVAKCEQQVARSLARFDRCALTCNVRAAKAAFKGRPIDLPACTQTGARSCRGRYDRASARMAQTGRCPACLSPAAQGLLADGSATTTTTSTTPAPSTTSTMPASSTTTTVPSTTTTNTTVAASTTSIAPTTSTTSTTLACAGEGAPCGAALDGCTARMVCVDGALVCRGTFVAPPPRGDPANPGTESAPVSSIGAGIENAALLGVGAVCACAGSYFEDLTIVGGISLRGGYDCTTWTDRKSVV